MHSPADPKGNYILASLPPADYQRLLPHLEPVTLHLGQPIYESTQRLDHMYFPVDSIVSLLYVMENGSSAEISVIGHDGVVGIGLFMGGGGGSGHAVVQNAGTALRMKSEVMKAEFDKGGVLQQLLLRYTQALMTQMAQTAVCNRHHSIEQQLCRWLLLSIDRLPSDDMQMTDQLVANMLGIRLDKVQSVAGKLQFARLIHYVDGHITRLDRPGLEMLVCECYQVVKKEYARLQPAVAAAA